MRSKNHVLWVSEGTKPDLGGHEEDENVFGEEGGANPEHLSVREKLFNNYGRISVVLTKFLGNLKTGSVLGLIIFCTSFSAFLIPAAWCVPIDMY